MGALQDIGNLLIQTCFNLYILALLLRLSVSYTHLTLPTNSLV